MIPELAARLQALEAERLRPVPPPPRPRVIDLEALTELCDALGEDEEIADDDGAGNTSD